jgi:methionyl-tRNA formyltransferase
MSVAFFGSGEFAVPALRAIAEQVRLVVTQPDRPSGRGLAPRPTPVKLAAADLGIQVAQPSSCRDPGFAEEIAARNLDALIVAAYGQILPQRLLDASSQGAFNLHASALPSYRGAAPIQHALLNGDTETGVTLMKMDKGMDTGDIIAIERAAIGPDEVYTELEDRLSKVAARLLTAWLPRLVSGNFTASPQDHERATLAPKLSHSDAELSFSRNASREYCRYRAFSERPGAWIQTRFGRLILRRARLDWRQGTEGEILSLEGGMTVGFAVGSLRIIEGQPEGKRRMAAKDLANGWRLAVGTNLTP